MEVNIKTCLKEISWEEVSRIYLVHDKDKWQLAFGTVIIFRVPQYTNSFFECLRNYLLLKKESALLSKVI